MPFPPSEPSEPPLGAYLRAMLAKPLVVALVLVATLGGSIVWLTLRSSEYQATAELLISPVPETDPTFLGLQVLRESRDPTRTAQTAAALLNSMQVAQLAAERLGGDRSARDVLSAVEVEPEGESNILAVSATAGTPDEAARVANVFASSALDSRHEAVRRQAGALIDDLQARRSELGVTDEAEAARIGETLGRLHALRESGDPSISAAQLAIPPTSSTGRPWWLIVALAAAAGLALGGALAVALEALDRRVRSTAELSELYPIPVLAHVPVIPRRWRRRHEKTPLDAPPEVHEAFRSLQVQLEQNNGGQAAAIMVTSATRGDGKTTTALHLAASLVRGGRRVVLIDFDLRHPNLAATLGVERSRSLEGLLRQPAPGPEFGVPVPRVPGLRLVAPAPEGEDIVALEALSQAFPAALRELRGTADYTVIDTPPLGEVSDALRVVPHVDGILLVARPGRTERDRFVRMRDLLDRAGCVPAGMVVIAEPPMRGSPYYLPPPHHVRTSAR